MTASPESELADALRRGDERAFEQLYRLHSDGLFHLAERMLGNAADAADVLQETFVAVFRRIETWRGEGSLKSWLYQIAVRFALRAKRRRPITIDFEDEEHATPPAVHDPPPAEMDFRAAVDQEIQRLPTRARMVFVMHTVDGMTHPEIARVLEVDEGTSKSQLHYARSLLKRRLARYERELA
ncbi:MAG: RNA polymerase sigma factor [Planctomycetes bacterium]|nr:RNA polymerase sigma factor [Planctomycetota bacterium]